MDRVKDWKLFKNLKRHEKEYIICVKDGFEKSGLDFPEIRLRGHPVNDQKLIRYRKANREPGRLVVKAGSSTSGPRRVIDLQIDPPPVKRRRRTGMSLAEDSSSSFARNALIQHPVPTLRRSIATPWSLRIQEIVFQSIDRCTDSMLTRGSPAFGNMADKFYTGTTMLRKKKNAIAWSMIQEGFAMVKDIIAGRYRLLLHCLFNLLCYNRFEGFDELRVALLRHFSEMSSTILGNRHPTTIICRLMATSPNAKEIAESAWQVQIDVFREKLGATDVDTLNSELDLARNYINAESYTQAETMLQDLLEKSKRRFGDRHPFSKSTISALSWCFQRQGYYTKSEAAICSILQPSGRDELAIASLESIWDEFRLDDHGSPVQEMTLRVELAYLREAQGKYQESETYFWKILECCLGRFGLNDHFTVETLENLERVMMKQGKMEGVEALRADFPAVLG